MRVVAPFKDDQKPAYVLARRTDVSRLYFFNGA